MGDKIKFKNQSGITLIEVILMAILLSGIGMSIPYFFAQNQTVMKSSSQTMECQTIAKEALTNTVSLGARLYGYKINDMDTKGNYTNLRYKPLFIKKNGANIDDVGDGSELSFPPKKYKDIYKYLGISPTIQDPKTNTDRLLLGPTYPFELSTSVLIVNSVNALQYLYNSDNGFFTDNGGMGKKYTLSSMSNGEMASLWEKYKDRFDLTDINYYIKIAPIDLNTNKEMASPPSKILTRPRFHNPKDAKLSPAFQIGVDYDNDGKDDTTNIGFEITVMLTYKHGDQKYSCNAKQRFSHQGKIVTKKVAPLNVTLTKLVTGANIDLKNNSDLNTTPLTPAIPTDLKLVSCDTHGSGYDDITLTVNFNTMGEGQQAGTVLLCRMNSYCRSYGHAAYESCVTELGEWKRCHNITPTTPQSWTYSVSPISDHELEMTFTDMKTNRRYELDVGEFSIAGHHLRNKTVAKFYLDAIRPEITLRRVTNDLVGIPSDGDQGREYKHPHPPTLWERPPNSSRKWLQCKTGTVEFAADQKDQFTHNLYKCAITGKKEDGTNRGAGVATSPTQTADCAGELSVTQHGRYTVTFAGGDTCGVHASSTKDLVWDFDDPTTFAPQAFTQTTEWFYSSQKDAYPIETEVPAIGAGKFPKHYSVDCDDNYDGSATRKDGNSGKLTCELSGSVSRHDDGCNLNKMGVKYYHVCGQPEANCNHSKRKKWGVYAPEGKSCLNVWCEPSLSCCDASAGTCNGVSDKQCGDPVTRHCTNPKGGIQLSSDETPSGCPPLGLNDCTYELPCEASSPFVTTGPTDACRGLRQGQSCSFSLDGTCRANAGAGRYETRPSNAGTCIIRGQTVGSCPASVNRFCDTYRTVTRRRCRWRGRGTNRRRVCTNRQVRVCDDYDFNLSDSTCRRPFTGACDPYISGSCSKKPQGGGNASLEKCDVRNPICCDRTTECCPGDTRATNSNCPPVCRSADRCCPGDTCTSNPVHCCQDPPCKSSEKCCPQNGDDHTNNPKCPQKPPCDPAKRCCPGQELKDNPRCIPEKVDGMCTDNGCGAGSQKMNTDGSWWCLGEGAGAVDKLCPKPCDPNKDCCPGNVGQCPCTSDCCKGDPGYPNCCDTSVKCCGQSWPSNTNCRPPTHLVCEPPGSGLSCFNCWHSMSYQASNRRTHGSGGMGGGPTSCTWTCDGLGSRRGESHSCEIEYPYDPT